MISRANKLAWRIDLDLALGDVTLLVSILPKTNAASYTDVNQLLIWTPWGTSSILFFFLECTIAMMNISLLTYPCLRKRELKKIIKGFSTNIAVTQKNRNDNITEAEQKHMIKIIEA